jgi:hypothetical protein
MVTVMTLLLNSLTQFDCRCPQCGNGRSEDDWVGRASLMGVKQPCRLGQPLWDDKTRPAHHVHLVKDLLPKQSPQPPIRGTILGATKQKAVRTNIGDSCAIDRSSLCSTLGLETNYFVKNVSLGISPEAILMGFV